MGVGDAVKYRPHSGAPVKSGTVVREPTDLSPFMVIRSGRREDFVTPEYVVDIVELPDVADINAVEEWLDA